MMKATWTKPQAMVEQFMANEYVAACYKIKCNVPSGNQLWSESNGIEGLQTSRGYDSLGNRYEKDTKLLDSYGMSGCNKWHIGVIRDDDPELNGYWVSGSQVTPVHWWHERLGSTYDYHATLLGSQDYETNPNAS